MLHVRDPSATNACCFAVDKIIVYECLEARFFRCTSVYVLGAIVVLANMQLYFLSLIDGAGAALICTVAFVPRRWRRGVGDPWSTKAVQRWLDCS